MLLYIFIEGADDKRFFESIIKPKLESRYDTINFIEYAKQTSAYIKNFIGSIYSYFAGLTPKSFQQLGINNYNKFATTNDLVKEAFNQNIPKKFNKSRIDFMREVLKLFNLETVTKCETNHSLCYFIHKYLSI